MEQQEQLLQEEISDVQKKLAVTAAIRQELKTVEHFSVDSIGDIAYIMKQKERLKRMRIFTILAAIPVEVMEWISLILWIKKGIWWPFAAWLAVAAAFGTFISVLYCRKIGFICPACHAVFLSRFKEILFAYHTPKMRRLTCPNCGRKGLCVETIYEKENESHE